MTDDIAVYVAVGEKNVLAGRLYPHDHLRNHGFLHERGESWVLSPAFDLNPGGAFEHAEAKRAHEIGGEI